MKITLLSLVLCLLCSLNMAAQGSDIGSNPEDTTIHQLSKKELRRRKVAKRNIHYNILGGPSYTPDFGALIGGSALVTFRMNPSDTLQKRSVLPMAVAVMFEGGLNLMVKPQLFFKNDKFRIFGKFTYKNTLENFYGIGYATNKHYERSDSTSEYRYSGFQINPWFLFRLGKSNFFAGPQIDLSYDKISEPAKYLVDQPDYKRLGGTAHGYSNFSSGVGFLLTYDSRDIPANAYKGIYLDFRGLMYQKFLGGDNNFYRLEVDYRQYKKVGNRKVIAWTAQTKNVFGDVPMNQYALSGTPFDLRGYYMGQYRDKSSHVVLAEYRQMFNTDKSTWVKRMLHHLGFVAWGGCGFMGPTMGKIEGVLPNAGVGLRIEVQPRMNVRLDFGRNFANDQSLFYFNMTEAFFGVIYVPVKETLYWGEVATGAYKMEGVTGRAGRSLEEMKASAFRMPCAETNEVFVIVASRSHLSAETEEYIEEKRKIYPHVELVSVGSSIKICKVCEGLADEYPRFAPTMEWDTAAGHAIAKASGAEIYQAGKEEPLKYNKPDLLNPWFVVKRN